MLHPVSSVSALLSANSCDKDEASLCGFVHKVTNNANWAQAADVILGPIIQVVVILAIAILVRRWLHKLINRTVNRITNGDPATTAELINRRILRARTLASVLQSVTSALVFGLAALMILQIFWSVAPLLASVSVVGVALGFGAQSLVKDVLAGLFMIVEDQYGVGDVIDVGNDVDGTVEAVGLRVTRIRAVDGTMWIVRNGEILRVGNKSQGWARAVVDVGVAHGVDVSHVEELLRQEGEKMRQDPAFTNALLGDPEVWGVETMTKDGLTIRVVVKTRPLKQWPVARELRRRITTRLEAEGIDQG
ncbi:mechanosensitive ion channel family protein [Spongisporangium articulatum]|uniref:Mechanosensitive ion channel family protein n=1 Tax=Spongisporangium articulatum TaxID=3362603 RepID=A0ABW8AL72_9ACTN